MTNTLRKAIMKEANFKQIISKLKHKKIMLHFKNKDISVVNFRKKRKGKY